MSRAVVLLLSFVGGFWRRPPVLVSLALNLIPVACVWWLGWNALTLLVLYWVENVAIGVNNALKLREIEKHEPPKAGEPFKLSGFFMLHYGLFTVVHGVFAFLVGGVIEKPDPGATFARFWDERVSFGLAVLAIFAVHGAELVHWLTRGGWRETTGDRQMMQPYGRIFILHLTVLGGAFVLATTKAPASYILLLAVLKTVIDAWWSFMQSRPEFAGSVKLEMRS